MVTLKNNLNLLILFSVLTLSVVSCKSKTEKTSAESSSEINQPVATTVKFTYQDITGIGEDSVYNRRDNSDIIKVGDTYYIWYSKMDHPETAGYWATIWYATSKDEGYTWQEQGMALGLGEEGAFDSHSVFTPNILAFKGKYYLYYTAVKPTPGNPDNKFENNSTTDVTAIGVAVSDSPDGTFTRIEDNPLIEVSSTPEDFDSFRVDDASLLIKDNKIWLYYKGRSIIHGRKGPGLTEMGVAMADSPEGPFVKHKGSLLDNSHEVLIWKENNGIASLASISKTINYAEDGINFTPLYDGLVKIPVAPGLYRPDLEDGSQATETPGWGISLKGKKGYAYFARFEIKQE
ncbi:family 43 glycosylhydrolase [Formosa sp. 3Alg 14/1]|uniref:family 43 glycosylhydrolase n=1 Tax=Formosa sp. 3Alg 14/1 TaxID=3382190 RepID=UPI0039BDE3DA